MSSHFMIGSHGILLPLLSRRYSWVGDYVLVGAQQDDCARVFIGSQDHFHHLLYSTVASKLMSGKQISENPLLWGFGLDYNNMNSFLLDLEGRSETRLFSSSCSSKGKHGYRGHEMLMCTGHCPYASFSWCYSQHCRSHQPWFPVSFELC